MLVMDQSETELLATLEKYAKCSQDRKTMGLFYEPSIGSLNKIYGVQEYWKNNNPSEPLVVTKGYYGNFGHVDFMEPHLNTFKNLVRLQKETRQYFDADRAAKYLQGKLNMSSLLSHYYVKLLIRMQWLRVVKGKKGYEVNWDAAEKHLKVRRPLFGYEQKKPGLAIGPSGISGS